MNKIRKNATFFSVENEMHLIRTLREGVGDVVFLCANQGNVETVLKTVHSIRIMRSEIPIILLSLGINELQIVKLIKAGASELIPKHVLSVDFLDLTLQKLDC
ncbi:MAG: hypothetical protein IPG90_18705 [Bacteroidetes bacterium]|nr:hypothetical protein [Bacteroidota bacterium]MBK9525221.1 hypothetical protein [Bacteroidota bacterium]MBK9543318.1 hypothetical protein [Bacteroidota bacterium]MBP6402420.1 hypothetical protein [Bacteroidia bacterium]